jgi:hypothetical protein
VIGSSEQHAIAGEIADKTVTLVKDAPGNLPLTPQTHPRIRLYGVAGAADSTSLPNHLIDVPMVKTVIHAHAPTGETMRATVQKIQGLSEFQGTFNDYVWCDTFGTRF